jgi:hypothetical protein
MNQRITTYSLLCGACLLAIVTQTPPQQGNNGESEVQRGFEIAPVLLNLALEVGIV